ncbi:MAG TPA: hypothetical protein VF079_05590 [Sphingomicrobium sp.]
MTGWRGLIRLLASFALLSAVPANSAPAVAPLPVNIFGGDAGEAQVSDEGEVHHRATGFVYPRQLGDMPQRKVAIYGEADVSVDYTLRGGGNGDAWITFYVYPARITLDEEAAHIEHDIVENWLAVRAERPSPAPASAPGARSGWFTGARENHRVTTGYVVVQRGLWFLMTRFSVPDEAAPDAFKRVDAALDDVPWTWLPPAIQRPAGRVASAF